MSKINILIEIPEQQDEAFELHTASLTSEREIVNASEKLMSNLSGMGLEPDPENAPIPMFFEQGKKEGGTELEAFNTENTNKDLSSATTVVSCTIEESRLGDLAADDKIVVWPNSPLTLMEDNDWGIKEPLDYEPEGLFDLANSAAGVDCRPFRPGATIQQIRRLLGVEAIWRQGFRGQNIVVGIIDEGVNGRVYPVVGGFARPQSGRRPGDAHITSHGSMCAADVLIASPQAKLYDYPFLGVRNSGGALTMFQAVLNQRRIDGTPHITNNSYGFVGRPDRRRFPRHEVWDINHPVHRKVREVVASGSPTFFAAGNCGADCPSGNCDIRTGVGPGKSIHASNSLKEVITVAAVNSRHERIGYSSQGEGGFHRRKPDISAYSHIFGNFGPGRPGGTRQPFDNGTSAATPVAAGVGALLMSAFPRMTPQELKDYLIRGAINLGPMGWDRDTGFGVVNAASTYNLVLRDMFSS